MEQVRVNLGSDSYNIFIGNGLSYGRYIREAMPDTRDLLIVSNDTVAPLYLEQVKKELNEADFSCHECILKDGEAYKTVDSYMQIMTALIANGLGRDCALVALGGGVVGDMTGFAAATYQRGVDFIQIPTTLLAMVDSSVGGKTAINHPEGKNMIGAFHQPKLVLAALDVLKTLPPREIAAGMAEVIKYGVILDREFFDYLAAADSVEKLDLARVVARCCELKAEVVSKDEKERGLRALLNYGHTFGHAVEVGMGFGTYLHGEAVAVGMAVAAFVAEKKLSFPHDEVVELCRVLKNYQLPVAIPDELTPDDFIRYMHHDKKVRKGHITYVLPESIGKSRVYRELDDATCAALIADFKQHF